MTPTPTARLRSACVHGADTHTHRHTLTRKPRRGGAGGRNCRGARRRPGAAGAAHGLLEASLHVPPARGARVAVARAPPAVRHRLGAAVRRARAF
eukprot:360298-Chlamydomonas_euryale.AAC.3